MGLAPKILRMLFQNEGAGSKLLPEIIPADELDYPPATPEIPGIVQPGTSDAAILLAGDVVDFEDSFYAWTNNSDGTGTLEVKKNHFAQIIAQGGGGQGGSVLAASGRVSAGGGSSGEARQVTSYLQQGDLLPCVFGIGGSGGDAGGATSLGNIVSSLGGNGGGDLTSTNTTTYLGLGGLVLNAMDGSPSYGEGGTNAQCWSFLSPNITRLFSGRGGNSLFGVGGNSVGVSTVALTATGLSGSGYGSGGSGAGSFGGSVVTLPGGNGAPGCIYIKRIG